MHRLDSLIAIIISRKWKINYKYLNKYLVNLKPILRLINYSVEIYIYNVYFILMSSRKYWLKMIREKEENANSGSLVGRKILWANPQKVETEKIWCTFFNSKRFLKYQKITKIYSAY